MNTVRRYGTYPLFLAAIFCLILTIPFSFSLAYGEEATEIPILSGRNLLTALTIFLALTFLLYKGHGLIKRDSTEGYLRIKVQPHGRRRSIVPRQGRGVGPLKRRQPWQKRVQTAETVKIHTAGESAIDQYK